MITAKQRVMVSLIKYVADPEEVLPAITYWLMGSMSRARAIRYKPTTCIERFNNFLFYSPFAIRSISAPNPQAATAS